MRDLDDSVIESVASVLVTKVGTSTEDSIAEEVQRLASEEGRIQLAYEAGRRSVLLELTNELKGRRRGQS